MRTEGGRVLGLPEDVRGCLFDLDGVLTRTAEIAIGEVPSQPPGLRPARSTPAAVVIGQPGASAMEARQPRSR
jgi:hypothetical protein